MAWKRPPARAAQTGYDVAGADELARPTGYPELAWHQQPYQDPLSLRGRAMFDHAVWQSPVFPVAEIVATNRQDLGGAVGIAGDNGHTPQAENITRWSPWESEGVTPLANGARDQPSGHNLLGTASFFASDPSRGPGSCSAGCYFSTDWTHMVMGQPGSVIIGHQTFWGPLQPKPPLDFFPSTVYQPFPSFGAVAKKVA